MIEYTHTRWTMGSVKQEDFHRLIRGAVVLEVKRGRDSAGQEFMTLVTNQGEIDMRHYQGCCESVGIEDIAGDVADLIGGALVCFEERSNGGETEHGSETWTFYEIRTSKGDITVRWYGESNGYYSEDVTVRWNGAEVLP